MVNDKMKNQILPGEVREAIKMARDITPIMNEDEYSKLLMLYNNVITRYDNEVFGKQEK